ncbi:assimilatory nitrate reductase (ferredoxin) precursor [Thalassoporum mexicanum PCC 7367]|uniref:molybdopterin oxidoreductase family protein n=1 Tax=Thalassoporum mexicanum TaxID=3457544 RepID=UPI00029FFB36|nr:nitrate reductase [Pseudanabaena sp. PCC 7367]AFY70612.1 assimilatory nitrate reductase (ferredoxin) precursor [Pseudanabaena sp. PCC 7367]
MDTVKTLCPYCGVGCGLEVVGQNNSNNDLSGWKVRGDRSHPSSQGMVCVKGATIIESVDVDRLMQPMVRDRLDQPFQPTSWDAALDLIVAKIQQVRRNLGSDGLCMYGSGQFQTEDYYTAQKLFKGCLGTNNFDANSRLCMSSAVSGYVQSFGADGPPCCYDDLEQTECAFLIGTNTAECHPIVFNRLRKHHKSNSQVKMIVVDPRRTPTAEAADLHLAIQPGSDIALLNGIAHLLLQWGKQDQAFIAQHTNGFEEFATLVKDYPPERVAQICGITVEDLETTARYWSESASVLSMWSMGINQSTQGTAKVQAIINLHLLTAQIGKPGAGPFSLTGQPNAMGGREAGGLAHLLPGYRSVTNPQHRADLEWFWRLPVGQISDRPGRSAWDIVRGLENNEIGLLWIAATNPAVSFPDLERTKAALRRSPFTIYQDAYYPIETSAYAHVLLPATQWSEKTGTMTNSERFVSLCPAFHQPIGESRDDWAIFAEVGRRLGFGDKFRFANSAQVYAEFVKITRDRPCDQSGISHALLTEAGPTQWPHPASSQRSNQPKRLYQDYRFNTADGRAKFGINHNNGLSEATDDAYPFVLTVGRLYGHWHTQTRTGRIKKIQQMHPQPFIEIHPRDAEEIAATAESWLEVKSRRGMARFPVKITKAIAPGVVFVPMHWGALWAEDAEANSLTHPDLDPISLQPELKACAVRLRVLSNLEVSAQTDRKTEMSGTLTQ